MKKTIIAISLLAAALFTACGEKPATPVEATVDTTASSSETAAETPAETEAVKAEATAADITAAVTAEIEIPSAVEKNADNIGAFYDVDTAALVDISVLVCGSGAYPDELAVFKFKDADSANAGKEAVQKRLDNQIDIYRDYTPDEMYKLDDAQIITKDCWVILTACADNSRAKEIIEGMI